MAAAREVDDDALAYVLYELLFPVDNAQLDLHYKQTCISSEQSKS